MRWASNRLGRRWVMSLAAAFAPLACGGGEDGPAGGGGSIQLSATPATLSVQQGSSGTVTVQLTRGGGFAGAVSVAITGLPAGVTTTITPTQLTGATTSASVAVDVAATVAPGTYTATVQASATGVGAATANYTLTVTAAPNYALTMNPTAVSIAQGATGTSTVNIARTNFPGAVALSLVNPPPGVTGTFNPASANDNSVLTVAVASTVAPGTHTLTIQGAATGPGNRTTTLALTVTAAPGFTMSLDPTTISLASGGSGTSAVAITRLNGFAGAVTFSLDNPPTGITATFNPASVTANASTMTVNVAATVASGNYTLTVQGTATGLDPRTAQLTVVVAAPAFTVSLAPAALTTQQGTSATSAITIGRTNFTGAVALTVDTPPAGITGTFTPGSTTGTTSTLALNVAANTPTGIYTLTIRGTATGLTDRVANLQVTVTAAPGSIAIALSPAAISVQQAQSGATNVNITRTNFSADVTFSATGLPGGVTIAFNPTTTTASTSTATINVAAGTAVGAYPITITASGTGVTAVSATLTVTVTSPGTGTNSEWQFCSASETPVFFAYQDGTGAWQRVTSSTTGTVTKFAFSLTQNRGGVAYIMQRNDALVASDASAISPRTRGRQMRALLESRRSFRDASRNGRFRTFARSSFATFYETQIVYGTATELTTLGGDNCTTTQATKTISGTVAGIGAGQFGVLSLGGSSTVFLGGISQAAVSFEGVATGTVDFVGTRSTTGALPDKVVLMRNLNIPDGGALPSIIDFNAAFAFAPATATATVNNSLGDLLILNAQLTTANGQTQSFYNDLAPSTTPSRTWAGLPSSQIVSGDVHSLFLLAAPDTPSPADFRLLIQYAAQVGTQTLTLGPKITDPTVTPLAIGAYPRFRFQGTIPVEYRQAVGISIAGALGSSNAVSIIATGGYLAISGGGSQFDLSMPDIAGLNGFPAASRLVAGANEVSTTEFGWTGSGILFVRPRDGDVLRAAVRMTTINVP